MNMELKRNWIAGQWVEGQGSRVNENPSDKADPVGTYAAASAAQVNDAVAAAKKAFHPWSRTSPQLRSEILDKVGTEILARKDELGRQLSREEGKTLAEGIGEATEKMSRYTFNRHAIAHRFCPVCGIHTHSEDTDLTGEPAVYVNLRCLDGFDLARVPVHHFDGRSM